ncbi:MAG: hypothetical protein ABW208_21250 [Pyrinomonadaceae bacterium]
MRRSIPSAELIKKVYQLAHAVLGDEKAAFEVTKKAAQGWEVEFRAQRDRTRYRLDPDDFRQKLIMNDELALQFLTLKLCERLEKAQEAAGLAGRGPLPHESYFVLRYIKHLLYKTVQHRSFHVVVGVCRLVYDFSRRETSQIYEALVQDLRLRKDDQMYKDWKLGLTRAMHEKRFPGLLSLEEGPQGVRQFRRRDDQGQFTDVARHALRLFSPWGTSCLLPETPTRRYSFDEFRFVGRNPDAESRVEEQRMYAAINPTCFSRLLTLLGLGAESDRLALPLFTLPDNGSTIPPPDFTNPPKLSEDKWMELVNYLTTDRRRRREGGGILSIEVEGVERVTLHLEEKRHAALRLEEDDDLIQVIVKQEGGNVLLGSLLLSSAGVAGDGRPWSGLVKLGWGKRLGITITPSAQDPYSTAGANMDVSYKEGGILSLIRRAGLGSGAAPAPQRPASAYATDGLRYLYPAIALVVLLAIALPLLWLQYRGVPQPTQGTDSQSAHVMPAPASPEARQSPTPTITPEGTNPSGAGSHDYREGDKQQESAPRGTGRNDGSQTKNREGKAPARGKTDPRNKRSERPRDTMAKTDLTRPGGPDNGEVAAQRPADAETSNRGDLTRGGGDSAKHVLTLREVKTIYVQPLEDEGADGEFQQALVKAMKSDAGLVVTISASGRNGVDAVLRWDVRRRGARWEVFANLVNRRGTELWSETITIHAADELSMRGEAIRRLLDSLKNKQARER